MLLAYTLVAALLTVMGVAMVKPPAREVSETGPSLRGQAWAGRDARVSRRSPVSLTVRTAGLYRGRTASEWAARFRHRTAQFQHARQAARQARRALLSRPSVAEAINLAATVYGNGATLWALARCESQLNPAARNASGASGLLQFIPSTFARTPFGGFSIWSPYASALAAGWMLQQGRRSEWVC